MTAPSIPNKPAILAPRVESIPAELRAIRAWVAWRLTWRGPDKGWTKEPINPVTGKLARTDDPATWTDFETAAKRYKRLGLDGIGLVRTEGWIFIDFDGVFDFTPASPEQPAQYKAKSFPWLKKISPVLKGRAYLERSPSGTGIHGIAQGSLPPDSRQEFDEPGLDHTGFAFYTGKRFFTFTGVRSNDSGPFVDLTDDLTRLHAELFPPQPKPKPTPTTNGNGHAASLLSDADILERARRAKNGHDFARLWGGDTTSYPSPSEADMALCCHLAFWTGKDAGRIDNLFRQSGLYREKWERQDYREHTIKNAIEATTDTYSPSQNRTNGACHDEEPPPPGDAEDPRQAHAGAADEWPEPAPMQAELPPVVPFTEDLLPHAFRAHAADVAERMQVPLDYPAVTLVICLAGAVNRRALIQPKANDAGWREVPNLWGGIAGPPGAKKSPAIQAATRALVQLQTLWRREHEAALQDFETAKEEYELRRAAWRDQFKAAVKKYDEAPKRPDAEPAEPKGRKLIVNDATFEALQLVMNENPAGILMIRDELTGWLGRLDQEHYITERGFALQSWNGNAAYDIIRIGRGNVHVPHCCMSVLGGIQPGRLRSYLVDTLQNGPANDGLIQRFQLLVWPDLTPGWKYVDRAPDATSEERVFRIFRNLVEMDSENPALFHFDTDGQELFVAWLGGLEEKIRGGELHPALVSHLSKYSSLMPSLALLFELADRGGLVDSSQARVSLEHTQLAAAWCDYLESHARRVYSCITTPQMRAARELAEKIKQRKVGADGLLSCRDVYLKGWSSLDSPEAVKQAAGVLEDAGWIRALATESGPPGGRPSNRYQVNPKVWQ